jgi:aldose 1-epimerase
MVLGLIAVLAMTGCETVKTSATTTTSSIAMENWGKTNEGVPVQLYKLRNENGAEAWISNYGGIITRLTMPDKKGTYEDVVLGHDKLADYLDGHPYFGCLVGRYANRIANGRFALENNPYFLATNNAPNHLHGGDKGFDKVVWDAFPRQGSDGPRLELRYVSRAGEEGYPGTLSVTAVYTLTNDNALRVEFTARTDATTVCNLTHHSYFNLRGNDRGNILDHQVSIEASRYTPVTKDLIPTGELAAVAGTPFDFTTPHAIGARIGADHEQLKFGKGYDHNWVIQDAPGAFVKGASVTEPESGRTMEVWTTEPGLQFYVGNFLNDTDPAKHRAGTYPHRSGFCFEPQRFPDSPNQSNFPTSTLKAGETYHHLTEYRFGVAK